MYFGGESLFAPLFDATKQVLSSEPMLPRLGAGYLPAKCARLGGTQELRDLFSPVHLTEIYGGEHEFGWLSNDITQNQTPDLYWYLRDKLEVTEVSSNAIIRQLDREFLESQPDDWILKLYEFLNGQTTVQRQWWFHDLHLIRLQNGSHTTAKMNKQSQAFLPSQNKTGFPTVRTSVCESKAALAFLKSLGLEEPKPCRRCDSERSSKVSKRQYRYRRCRLQGRHRTYAKRI